MSRRHMRSAVAGPLAGAMLAIAMTACAGSAASEPVEDSPAIGSEADGLTTPRLPLLERYLVRSTEEARVMYNAKRRLIARCMRDHGFDYVSPEFVPANLAENRYGVVDVAEARKNGYGLDRPSRAQPTKELVDSLSSEERESWIATHGNADSGCVADADRHLRGDRAEYDDLRRQVRTLLTQAYDQLNSHPVFKQGLKDWNACMSNEGFHVSTLEDVHALYPPRPDRQSEGDAAPSKPSQDEIAVAVADASCKDEVDFVDRWRDAERAIQSRIAENHEGLLLRLSELRGDALHRARQVSASSSAR